MFDREVLFKRKERAAVSQKILKHDLPLRLIADTVLSFIAEKYYTNVLNMGCHAGLLSDILAKKNYKVINTDYSQGMLRYLGNHHIKINCNETALPFRHDIFDLIISPVSMTWIEDKSLFLKKIHNILRAQGLFIAALPGPYNLIELKNTIYKVSNKYDKHYPILPPFPEPEIISAKLIEGNFINPLITNEFFTIQYKNPIELLQDIRHCGESNILSKRYKKPRKGFIESIIKNYPIDPEGDFYNASFNIIIIQGNKPE